MLPAEEQRAERWLPVLAAAGCRATVLQVRRVERIIARAQLERVLAGSPEGCWLVLGSGKALGDDWPDVLRVWRGPVLAVGRRTAEVARLAGARDVRLPDSGGGLAAAIESLPWQPGQHVLWLRGEEVAVDVAVLLGSRGVAVEALTTYRMVTSPVATTALADWARDRAVEPGWLVATSPATVRAMLAMLPWPWPGVSIVALGETTAEALRAMALPVRAVAAEATVEAVRDAIVRGC